MASDKCSNIQEPRLLLQLVLQTPNHTKREVLVELSMEDLDRLLADFSKIQTVIRKVMF